MPTVVVDTDVLSYQFKGDTRAPLYDRHLAGKLWVISFMTLAELRWWTLSRRWGKARKAKLAEHLRQRVQICWADSDLCDRWAEATWSADRKGRPIRTADAWIAATALMLGVPLVTNNPADFAGVDGLRVLTEAMP